MAVEGWAMGAAICVLLCVVGSAHPTDSEFLSRYASFSDRMLPGAGESRWTAIHNSPETCAETCYTRSIQSNTAIATRVTCRSFEYVVIPPSGGVCVFSSVSAGRPAGSGYRALRPAAGTTYYEPSRDLLGIFQESMYEYTDIEGYSSLLANTSFSDCAYTCIRAPHLSCSSFAYNDSLQACAIRDRLNNSRDPLMEDGNYSIYQYTQDWPCNVTLPWQYTPHVIASPQYPYIPHTPFVCYYVLLAPPGDQVVLTVTSFFTDAAECSRDDGIFIYDGISASDDTQLARLCSRRQEIVPTSYQSSNSSIYVVIASRSSSVQTKMHYDYTSSNGCDGHGCEHGATCRPVNDSHVCDCLAGFSGRFCQTNMDDCISAPCAFGYCVDGVDNYTCVCHSDITGRHCDTYIGACRSNPCVQGTCHPRISGPGYACSCYHGYTGANCEYDLDECYSSPCRHGRCVELAGGYMCICDLGYSGKRCDVSLSLATCTVSSCRFGACAMNKSGSFCQCFPGFTGTRCDVNIDECQCSPCIHGNCTDHIHGYTCTCEPGATGRHCDVMLGDPCLGDPCVHGYCSIRRHGHYCACVNGYTGSRCETVITPCMSMPCHSGTCTENGDTYTCLCDPLYTGDTCETRIDTSCETSTGDICSTTAGNDCESKPCVHGLCTILVNIIHTGGINFTCHCLAGYSGQVCDKPIPCYDVNCTRGRCVDNIDGYTCVCDQSYTGTHCETRVSPCDGNPCGVHGVCVDRNRQTEINIIDNNRIDRLETIHNETKDSAIQDLEIQELDKDDINEMDAEEGSSFDFVCVCRGGYTGVLCEVRLDVCKPSPCRHGRCRKTNGYFTCICPVPYTGVFCESLSNLTNNWGSSLPPNIQTVTTVPMNSLAKSTIRPSHASTTTAAFPDTVPTPSYSAGGSTTTGVPKYIQSTRNATISRTPAHGTTTRQPSTIATSHVSTHPYTIAQCSDTCVHGLCVLSTGVWVVCICEPFFTGVTCESTVTDRTKPSLMSTGTTPPLHSGATLATTTGPPYNTVTFTPHSSTTAPGTQYQPVHIQMCSIPACRFGLCLVYADNTHCACEARLSTQECKTKVNGILAIISNSRSSTTQRTTTVHPSTISALTSSHSIQSVRPDSTPPSSVLASAATPTPHTLPTKTTPPSDRFTSISTPVTKSDASSLSYTSGSLIFGTNSSQAVTSAATTSPHSSTRITTRADHLINQHTQQLGQTTILSPENTSKYNTGNTHMATVSYDNLSHSTYSTTNALAATLTTLRNIPYNSSIQWSECISTCKHGRCVKMDSSHILCTCHHGYSGGRCNNSATCPPGYCVHGTCQSIQGNTSCVCDESYTGRRCDVISAEYAGDTGGLSTGAAIGIAVCVTVILVGIAAAGWTWYHGVKRGSVYITTPPSQRRALEQGTRKRFSPASRHCQDDHSMNLIPVACDMPKTTRQNNDREEGDVGSRGSSPAPSAASSGHHHQYENVDSDLDGTSHIRGLHPPKHDSTDTRCKGTPIPDSGDCLKEGTNPFFPRADGGIGLRLSTDNNESPSPWQFRAWLDQFIRSSGYKQPTRENRIQTVRGTNTGNSEV